MNRRDFLNGIATACVAASVPAWFVPKIVVLGAPRQCVRGFVSHDRVAQHFTWVLPVAAVRTWNSIDGGRTWNEYKHEPQKVGAIYQHTNYANGIMHPVGLLNPGDVLLKVQV